MPGDSTTNLSGTMHSRTRNSSVICAPSAIVRVSRQTVPRPNGPRVISSTSVTVESHSHRLGRSVKTRQTSTTGASTNRVTATVDIA
jgi:hypothetical protein